MNNLSLNTTKNKEILTDFRRKCNVVPASRCINGVSVESVEIFKFLGVLISKDLSWSANTSATIKRALQRLYFCRVLRKNDTGRKLMVSFYWTPFKSLLMHCISVWYEGCYAADKKSSAEGR